MRANVFDIAAQNILNQKRNRKYYIYKTMVAINCRGVIFQDIQAIIFDKDGTLEDSQEFLRNLGQKLTRIIDAKIPGIGKDEPTRGVGAVALDDIHRIDDILL